MIVPLTLFVILLNVIAIGLIALLKQERAKAVATGAAAISLAISVFMIVQFVQGGSPAGGFYIPYLNVPISLGLTGVSAVLLLMAEIVIFIAAASGNTENAGFKASAVLLSVFQIAAVGLFTSMNLLLFFIFWDIGVIAMFLMINVLGSEGRRAASINFLLYELFASSMLLIAIMLLYVYAPGHSLEIGYLASVAASLPSNVQIAVLISFFLAFMTNMAIFPLHLWLPDAYVEASTQGSMLLSGVLSKFGGYGMIIMFMLLSNIASQYSIYIAGLGIASAIYAALLLIRQKDLKRVIAYSGMLEMGVILVAIAAYTSVGTYGAAYGILSQGIAIALAFLAIGIIKRLFDERSIDRLRDILSGSRATAYSFALAAVAMIGFPLTSGFIGELLIFLGAVQGFGLLGLLPLIAILIMGAYLYSIISNCFLSRTKPLKASGSTTVSERFGLYALSASLVIFGIMPFILLGLLRL